MSDSFVLYAIKYVYYNLSRFTRYLKEATDGASLISSGRAFQALIVKGKKKTKFVLA